MSKIRAFFGIDSSGENKENIFAIQKILKEPESEIKWENKEKLHVTMKFLGDIDEYALKEMIQDIRNEVKIFEKFEMQFDVLGCFPNIKFPRVIWIGCKNQNDKLNQINEIIENVAVNFDFPKEKGKFHPHITLGRVKGNRGLDQIAELIKHLSFEKIVGTANEITVFKSTLQKSGSIYTIVDKISFTK
jgi:RNA 2',3'-cyclic 3'-phosphodiesterase